LSTILAVDDSTTMRKCLEITFAGTEFTLVAVDNAQEALEKVKTIRPALVIADVSLPTDGIADGGYELVSTLKLAQPDLPVLMLSSRQHPFDPTKGAQANGHIDKPFDTQALQDRVREMVRPAERVEELPMQMQQSNVAPSAMKQVAVPERAPPSSKIPAPRRKRPTPAMMPTPQPAPPTQPGGPSPKPQAIVSPAAAQAAMRRTVPFAMPSNVKRTAQGTGPTTADFGRRQPADRTMPMLGPNALAGLQGRAVTQPQPTQVQPPHGRSEAQREMQRTSPSAGVEALRKTQPQVPQPSRPAGDTLPGVQIHADEAAHPPSDTGTDGGSKRITERGMQAAEGGVAAVPTTATGDLRTRLAGLGLTREQVEGVLALSREIVEAAVWEVVPTLAETLIKEEIRRLTKD
jgi:CheY-like chemotaxis protein